MDGFTRTLVTRGYELDARRRVGPGTLARYFEDARWAAIADRATGLSTLFEEGRKLVMRAQTIMQPTRIRAHETLTLSLEVAHVGTSSLRFLQTARRGDEVVAETEAVAVVLDRAGKPTRAPDRVRTLATGRAAGALAPLGDVLPQPAYACDVYVRPSDLDTLQHVNQSRYVDFIDDVFQHALAQGAYGPGTPARVRTLTVEYRRETRLDPAVGPASRLVVETFGEGEATFGFALRDPVDGGLRARGKIVAAHEASTTAGADRDPGL